MGEEEEEQEVQEEDKENESTPAATATYHPQLGILLSVLLTCTSVGMTPALASMFSSAMHNAPKD